MGLFSRKKSAQDTRRATRATTSSDAQAAELRARARRRLVGALALVLAAVLIVPQIFDEQTPAPEQTQTPVVLPATVPPIPDPDLALSPSERDFTVDTAVLPEPDPAVADLASIADEPAPTAAATDADTVESQDSPASTAAETRRDEPTEAASPPQSKPDNKPEKSPKPSEPSRTDDGSVALALLEGRAPPQSGSTSTAQPQKGNFILQVAAYSTESDAQARRNRLVEAGVTNAYVEQGRANNKTTYRLRVGSFPSRDAAQAAQARLRALGYDNSLLLTQ